MHRGRCEFVRIAILAALLQCGGRLSVAATAAPEFKPDEVARGQKIYMVHCARCHGMLGRGGVGPSLARPVLTQAPDLKSLVGLIENGIPGTAMPPSWMLPDNDRQAVAAFVQTLGLATETPVDGDSGRGRELFAKAACAQCHTVDGRGGVKGPDLSEVGDRRGAAHLRQMLTEPGAEKSKAADGYTEFLPVRITLLNGTSVEGLRMNEDGFTIQLRDLEDRIHSFRKAEIKEVKKSFGQSIMPSFAAVFSPAELDDVVAYLVTLRGKK
jgi:cytochrome c oxidase cbb3-type subunit 3